MQETPNAHLATPLFRRGDSSAVMRYTSEIFAIKWNKPTVEKWWQSISKVAPMSLQIQPLRLRKPCSPNPPMLRAGVYVLVIAPFIELADGLDRETYDHRYCQH